MARLMAAREAESLAERAVTVDGLRVVAARVEGFDEPRLREMADVIRAKIREGVVVLGAVADGRPLFIAAATKGAVSAGAAAGAIVGRVAELAGGKGGGRPDLARGGGKDPALLGEALARVPAIVQELVRPGGRGA
jgi:alanyl-tRNA synthetase